MSERTFRRWLDRFEADCLYDRRLGKVSGRQVRVDTVMKVLEQFDPRYFVSTAKHFWDKPVSEHGFKRSYNWIRPTLQAYRCKAKAPSSMARGAWPSTKRTERAGRKPKNRPRETLRRTPGLCYIKRSMRFVIDTKTAGDLPERTRRPIVKAMLGNKHGNERKYNHILEPEDAQQLGKRPCDWPDCHRQGLHRAPRSRDDLENYFWFCLDHVRMYNKAWNYYKGMSEEEVEADLRNDTVWHRPTWPLGEAGRAFTFAGGGMFARFGIFGRPGNGRPASRPRRPETPEVRAMKVLDLEPPVSVATVKARYKVLVKRHHPDATGGDKESEEKFKLINNAYRTIMDSLAPSRPGL